MGTGFVRGLALALILCISGSVAHGQTEWMSLGPPGGGSGGRLVLHPTGTLVLIQGSNVYRSPDGRSWTRIGILDTSWPIASLIATRDGFLYAAARGGVYRSDDVGRWWRKVNNESLPVTSQAASVTLAAEPGGGLLAGLDDPGFRRLSRGGVWRSDDGGVNWRSVSTGLPTDDAGVPIAIDWLQVTEQRVAFATTYRGETFRWAEGGTMWLPTGPPGEAIRVVTSSARAVYAAGSRGWYRSLNGGASWEAAVSPVTGSSVGSAVTDPEGAVFVITTSQVWKSTDGAASWSALSGGLTGGSIEQLVVSSPSRLHAVSWDGLFASEDGGESWSLASDGLPPGRTIGPLLVDALGRVYIGGFTPSFTDDGRTWTSLLPQVSDAGPLRALVATASGAILLLGDDAVFRTSDGASWTRVHGTLGSVSAAAATQTSVVVATGTYPGSTVRRSTDDGATWSSQPGPAEIQALVADATGTLYAGTMSGVFASADEGMSWRTINTGLEGEYGFPRPVYALATGSAGVLYAATWDRVFRTTNGGTSWSRTTVPAVRIDSLAVNGRGDVFAAAEAETYVSRDGGAAWRSSGLAQARRLVADPTNASRVYAASNTGVHVFEDQDGDTLPDVWERRYGSSPASATGADGVDGDPDADGVTNGEEFQANTHPRGFHTRFFAEGAISDTLDLARYRVTTFFDTRFALLNPGEDPAEVILRFQRSDRAVASYPLTVAARARATVNARDVPGLPGALILDVGLRLDNAEFATEIESDRPIVVDRTMTWDDASYGGHTEGSIPSPAMTWYLAEGATHSGFQLFYLLQNPSTSESQVRVRYLRPDDIPMEQTYALPPNSRTNIWVNLEEFPGLGAALASTDVSAVFEVLDGEPIIVERAMYLDLPGQAFGAGHASAAVTSPATEWFLAEGATGDFFDLFVLVANPNSTDAQIEGTFMLEDGTTLVKTYTVKGNTRFNIWVDLEDPLLADAAVSTTIRSTNGVPIIVERAMWWPGPTAATWAEGHNTVGATVTGTRWALAEGEVDASRGMETYILIANTSGFPAAVQVTLLFEDGTSVDRTYDDLPARSRFNVPVALFFPESAGRRFGAVVESLGATPAQLVVERAMYWDALGQKWAAGTNALATRLR